MSLSIFDVFRIGIGPSSSHTVGPMRAATLFVTDLADLPLDRVQVELYGSLGATGRGHGTDIAVILGLLCIPPDAVDADSRRSVSEVLTSGVLPIGGRLIDFSAVDDLIFDGHKALPKHPNGMVFTAFKDGQPVLRKVFYSIGGGEIEGDDYVMPVRPAVPYPFTTMSDLIDQCNETGFSIAKIIRENEAVLNPDLDLSAELHKIWRVMDNAIERGLHTEGLLPGGLRVRRRAPELYCKLNSEQSNPDPLRGLDWITVAAFAVSEENAAGGQVVTAPTNGAAGVIPAVLYYYQHFIPNADHAGIERMLLTAAAIGMIFKQTASISGAEVGCQGEIGTACSMAAAGLAAVLGGSVAQIENAAEIGLEHNLGLTCDPISGLVQVPCIERNGIGAVKAITAARTALRGDGKHLVSFDSVVATMMATGRDMSNKYKETSEGGLAVNVPQC